MEPLRDGRRPLCPRPGVDLPPLPTYIPPQAEPFTIPDNLEDILAALWKPVHVDYQVPKMPNQSSKPEGEPQFIGGSSNGHERIRHLISSGAASKYKETRNGLLGRDYSTRLSAYLAQGALTARQIHWTLVDFEDGKTPLGAEAPGYGQGENVGTAAIRFELLWRDYMRLCTKKFGRRLFHVGGFRKDTDIKFRLVSSPYKKSTEKMYMGTSTSVDSKEMVERFLAGRTGTGLIDASQRELYLTGHTSNRARQNVASYLAKHLGIDWRIGAEWYETNLIDYDVSSNWGNWQYVSGVGNDPRGQARIFNPVKQAVDYDSDGEYVRTWVPELRDVGTTAGIRGAASALNPQRRLTPNENLENLMGVFQAWRMPVEEKKRLGLEGVDWVEKPLVRIDFSVHRRGGGARRGRAGGEGRGRGRGGGGSSRGGGGGVIGRGDNNSNNNNGRGRGGGLSAQTGVSAKMDWNTST